MARLRLAGVDVTENVDVEFFKRQCSLDSNALKHSVLAYLLVTVMCPDIEISCSSVTA
jgi:hypothetical protein